MGQARILAQRLTLGEFKPVDTVNLSIQPYRMARLLVSIDRVVDSSFPQFVECSFPDAGGRNVQFVEKLPVVAGADDFLVPTIVKIECLLVEKKTDQQGNNLAKIDISEPWGITTEKDESVFWVNLSQVRD